MWHWCGLLLCQLSLQLRNEVSAKECHNQKCPFKGDRVEDEYFEDHSCSKADFFKNDYYQEEDDYFGNECYYQESGHGNLDQHKIGPTTKQNHDQ